MDFIKAVFSDNGIPSSSRILSAIAMLFSCYWVTILVRHNWALPDFAGIALFVGVPYGINKITGVIGDISVNRTNGHDKNPG